MNIKCIQNQGAYGSLVLPQDIFFTLGENNYCCSNEWFTIEPSISGYCLSCEKLYSVYGILIANGNIRYLLNDDNNIPGFFPDTLFQIVAHNISLDWECHLYSGPSASVAYFTPSDINSYQDIIGIMSGNSSTVRRFIELREWFDKWNFS